MYEDTLLQAIKEARTKEMARLEAMFNMQDLRALRLEALHDLIAPEIANNENAKSLFDLSLHSGEVPRLWLGLNSFVVMEPDPKTYRLEQITEAGRATLFETVSIEAMRQFTLKHLAYGAVAQAIKPVPAKPIETTALSHGFSLLELATVGALCLLGGMALMFMLMVQVSHF